MVVSKWDRGFRLAATSTDRSHAVDYFYNIRELGGRLVSPKQRRRRHLRRAYRPNRRQWLSPLRLDRLRLQDEDETSWRSLLQTHRHEWPLKMWEPRHMRRTDAGHKYDMRGDGGTGVWFWCIRHKFDDIFGSRDENYFSRWVPTWVHYGTRPSRGNYWLIKIVD